MQSSRFACLPDDDEADAKVLKQQEKERKKEEAKKNAKNKPKEMPKAQKEAKDLQNLAFGGSSKKKNKKKTNKQTTPGKDDSSNFEEWKERDKAAVEDNFTAAMQAAILQSKLDFEQQKEVEAAQQELLTTGQGSQEVMASLDKEDRKKVVKLQKKLNTMTLDQFNSASEQKDSSDTNGDQPFSEPQLYRHPRHRERAAGPENGARPSPEKEVKKSGDFFEQLDSATVTALDREQLLESYRHQDLRTLAALPEASMVAGYQERLAASDKLLLEARKEIIDLNGKLSEAKVRTKKLTEILLSGEMKEKTEVLVQVHKLEKVKDELTDSLRVTSGQLEQERSLVRSLEVEVRRVREAGQLKGAEMELCTRLLALLKANRK